MVHIDNNNLNRNSGFDRSSVQPYCGVLWVGASVSAQPTNDDVACQNFRENSPLGLRTGRLCRRGAAYSKIVDDCVIQILESNFRLSLGKSEGTQRH